MQSTAPSNRLTLKVKVTWDSITHRKVVTVGQGALARIKKWNASSCVYVIVSGRVIQYVGCSTSNFFARFTYGIRQAHAKGYRWPTYDGSYQLFVWNVGESRPFVEAVEAEVAFLHRAALGDWPIELNQISPKRHLVYPEASSRGKLLAFGIYAWLLEKELVVSQGNDLDLLRVLLNRSVIC